MTNALRWRNAPRDRWPGAARLALAGLLLAAAAIQAALAIESRTASRFWTVVLLYAAAAAVWLTTLWLLTAWPLSWRHLVVLGGLLRLVAVTGAPWLETDMYRFRWDGRVLLSGTNPYRYAPDDPALAHLRDEAWEHINFPEVPTIYGPAAQGFFAVASALGLDTVKGFQLWGALLDLALMLLMVGWARSLGVAPVRVGIYALCPLPILQFANGAHVTDQLMLLALIGSQWAMAARRPDWGAVGLALAVLIKPTPLLLLPFYLRRWRPSHIGAFSACVIAAYLPFAAAGPRLFEGLRRFAHEWTFNAGLFRWTRDLLQLLPIDDANALARHLMAAVLLLILVQLVRRDTGSTGSLPRQSENALLALLLTSPVANAWYIAWLGPFTILRARPAVLVWFATSILANVWCLHDPSLAWLRVVEYAPVYLLLAWEVRPRAARPS